MYTLLLHLDFYQWVLYNAFTFVLFSRKFKERICCGGHLGVTYGAELLSSKCELPFPHNGYRAVNEVVIIMSTDHSE